MKIASSEKKCDNLYYKFCHECEKSLVNHATDDLDIRSVCIFFLLYNILPWIGILRVHAGWHKGEYLISICRPVPRSIPSKPWMRTASSLSSESFLCVGIRVCPADRHIWYRALRMVSTAWIEIDPGTMLGTGRSRSESARVYVETSARDWHPTAPLETVKTFHPVSRRVWPWRFVAMPIILLGGFTVHP